MVKRSCNCIYFKWCLIGIAELETIYGKKYVEKRIQRLLKKVTLILFIHNIWNTLQLLLIVIILKMNKFTLLISWNNSSKFAFILYTEWCSHNFLAQFPRLYWIIWLILCAMATLLLLFHLGTPLLPQRYRESNCSILKNVSCGIKPNVIGFSDDFLYCLLDWWQHAQESLHNILELVVISSLTYSFVR